MRCKYSNWYGRLPQVYEDDWSSFLQMSKKQTSSKNRASNAQLEALAITKKITKMLEISLSEIKFLLNKDGVMNSHSPLTSNAKNILLVVPRKDLETSPMKDTLNMFPAH